jgi:hypothetical protein
VDPDWPDTPGGRLVKTSIVFGEVDQGQEGSGGFPSETRPYEDWFTGIGRSASEESPGNRDADAEDESPG